MKTLKDMFEVYRPKSPDEQKFVDKHVTVKHKDRNEVNGKANGDDVFKATNIKTIEREKTRHGYDLGADEKVYEENEFVNEEEELVEMDFKPGGLLNRYGAKIAGDPARQKGKDLADRKQYRAVQGTTTPKVRAVVREEEELDEANAENKLKKNIEVVKAGQKEIAQGINFARYQPTKMADNKGHDYGLASHDDDDAFDNASARHTSRKTAIRTYKVAGRKAMKEELVDEGMLDFMKKKSRVTVGKPTRVADLPDGEKPFQKMMAAPKRVADLPDGQKPFQKIMAAREKQKLTKEDIINRTIEKYMPEVADIKALTMEERLAKKLDGLSESHIALLFSLFTNLNEDKQIKMIESCSDRDGINDLIDFALENRGE